MHILPHFEDFSYVIRDMARLAYTSYKSVWEYTDIPSTILLNRASEAGNSVTKAAHFELYGRMAQSELLKLSE